MAKTDADVAVVVSGDTSQLRSDLKKGGASLKSFGDEARKTVTKIAKVGAAAVAAAAAIGVALFKASAESAKEIQNLSRLSGVSAKQFQKLAIAAKGYGIEQDKLSDILKDTNDKVGDFLTTGGGALADYFEFIAPKIGQTAEEFKNLSSDQVLQKYINGLEKANVSQAEFTFYMEAIASDSTALLPLLKNNGEEFQKIAKNIEDMGLALSDVEVEQLSKVHDTFAEMSRTTKMFINKVMAQFAPVIQVIADKYKELTSSSQNFGQTAVKVFATVAKSVAFVGDAIQGIKVIINGIKLTFQTMVVGITTAVLKLLELVNTVQQAVVKSQNVLIRGLNKIPKVNIDELVVGDIEAIAKIESFQQSALGVMDEGVQNLHNSLMKPLPTEMVDSFLEEINRASEEAAKLNIAKTSPIFGSDADDEVMEATERKYMGYFERRQTAQEEANNKLLANHKDTLLNQEKLDRIDEQRKRNFVSGTSKMFGDLSSLMSSENKKLFNIGKAAAIAQASIDGIAAAVSSYKFGASIGGPLLGGAFAAASAIATGQMIKQISSQQASGGSASTPNVSGGAASTPQPPQTQNQTVENSGGGSIGGTLTVQGLDAGALFTGDAVSGLAEELLEYQRNGGRVVLQA